MPKNNKYYIAVDFDGTLCYNCFPEIGALREIVISDLMEQKSSLESLGYEVVFILWTCRTNPPERAYLDEAVKWWKDNGYDKKYFPFTYINENPECDFGHPELAKKIVADEYWDDKAVRV